MSAPSDNDWALGLDSLQALELPTLIRDGTSDRRGLAPHGNHVGKTRPSQELIGKTVISTGAAAGPRSGEIHGVVGGNSEFLIPHSQFILLP